MMNASKLLNNVQKLGRLRLAQVGLGWFGLAQVRFHANHSQPQQTTANYNQPQQTMIWSLTDESFDDCLQLHRP